MKFVALISGGKDSFFNIMHCLRNGHSLDALANLHPRDKSVNELDSFMFQTVGHDIIDFYKECIGGDIPLYRRAINGSSSNIDLEYKFTSDDEIEDLYELLKEIKVSQPDIEGVSCGAILSQYQRTRVENVCDRLGLTSLAYLWQRDQTELMLEMCLLGLEAVLIKVAAIGLNDKHLGKTLHYMFPILQRLNASYDVHVCGEGGEFETLVLDAPFFVKKLQIVKQEVSVQALDVSYLSVSVELVEKKPNRNNFLNLECPPLLSNGFELLDRTSSEPLDRHSLCLKKQTFDCHLKPRISRVGGNIYISNISSSLETASEQTADILQQIDQVLLENKLPRSRIQHVCVLVQDISNFPAMNMTYKSFFSEVTLPPSRVCIETPVPGMKKLVMSCMVSGTKNDKTGIHIRSRSYWAPQNIGPYSQAIVQRGESLNFATISGQIPLIPNSMEFGRLHSMSLQSSLSLQHFYRVKTLINVREIASCICYITKEISPAIVSQIWGSYITDIESKPQYFGRLLILQVLALPRHASVEWGGLAVQRELGMYADKSKHDYDGDESIIEARRRITSPFQVTFVSLVDTVLLQFFGCNVDDLVQFLNSPELIHTQVHVFANVLLIQKLLNMGLTAEWLPVLGLYDNTGKKHSYAVIWIS